MHLSLVVVLVHLIEGDGVKLGLGVVAVERLEVGGILRKWG